MIDIKLIRENTELYKKACKDKNVECDIDRLLELDEKRRTLIQEVINEVEFHGETPAGQLYGTEEEDARFEQQLAAEQKNRKITKKKLQKIVQEEFNAFLSETERTIK